VEPLSVYRDFVNSLDVARGPAVEGERPGDTPLDDRA
jgi:hypothetical protein